MTDLRSFLKDTILEAGELALKWYHRRDELGITSKHPKDIVSEADVAVENLIRSKVTSAFPEYGFFGEESGITESTAGRWIVDPIDGTVSFVRGQYHWCISIALEIEGQLTYGAVYAPAVSALYIAEKGKGAFRNDQPIHVSEIDSLNSAVLATGFACLRASLPENNLPRLGKVAPHLSGTRVLGSAAFDCCLVADGRIDGFWEQHLNLYDIAAGTLIAQEAGARLTDFKGNPSLNPEEILLTNDVLHDTILQLFEGANSLEISK